MNKLSVKQWIDMRHADLKDKITAKDYPAFPEADGLLKLPKINGGLVA